MIFHLRLDFRWRELGEAEIGDETKQFAQQGAQKRLVYHCCDSEPGPIEWVQNSWTKHVIQVHLRRLKLTILLYLKTNLFECCCMISNYVNVNWTNETRMNKVLCIHDLPTHLNKSKVHWSDFRIKQYGFVGHR